MPFRTRRAGPARLLSLAAAVFFIGLLTPVQSADLTRYGLKDSLPPARHVDRDVFSLELGVGRLEGEARELVFDNATGRKVSELFWTLDNVTMLNAKGSLRITDWFRLRASGSLALNGNSVMDDYDWLSGGSNWSHWSHHPDTELKHAHMLDLGAELRFLNHSGFEVFALGGYKWDRLSWEARGGSYIYSVGGFRDTRGGIPPGQLAISYTQDFGTPYIGLGAGFAYGPFSVRGSVVASHAARGEDKDTHHLRDLLFESEFRNGRYIMAEAELAYEFSDRLAIVGSYQYQNYDEVRGTTKILHKPTGLVFSGYGPAASGAELETQMFSLAARYALQ